MRQRSLDRSASLDEEKKTKNKTNARNEITHISTSSIISFEQLAYLITQFDGNDSKRTNHSFCIQKIRFYITCPNADGYNLCAVSVSRYPVVDRLTK